MGDSNSNDVDDAELKNASTTATTIRRGRDIIKKNDGTYLVGETKESWDVDSKKYELVEILGIGSYGTVVKAYDCELETYVALKRIANALYSKQNAKRTLREIVALNRVSHPNVAELLDVFVRPAQTGARKFINGKFVCKSLDVYLSFELAEGGDLYDLRGQLDGEEVRSFMKQLVSAVGYLHENRIWHRDLKSANALLGRQFTKTGGGRVIKICDFGSARGAPPRGGWRESEHGRNINDVGRSQQWTDDDSEEDDENNEKMCDIVEDSPQNKRSKKNSYANANLTGVVATPCYRAPEVVMNSGSGAYTAAVDVWSLGCIFAELLRREMHSASALTPKLHVQPLFQFDDEFAEFQTPRTLEKIESDDSRRAAQLDKYFDTIGTPGWFDIESLSSDKWRKYLSKMAGRSGMLQQIFCGVDADALDLLTRMLAFDPRRRPTCEEIAYHAYFTKDLNSKNKLDATTEEEQKRRNLLSENVSKMNLGENDENENKNDYPGGGTKLIFTPSDEIIPEVSPRSRSKKLFCEHRHPGDALAALEKAFEDANEVNAAAAAADDDWSDIYKKLFESEIEIGKVEKQKRFSRTYSNADLFNERFGCVSNADKNKPPREEVQTQRPLTALFPTIFRREPAKEYTGDTPKLPEDDAEDANVGTHIGSWGARDRMSDWTAQSSRSDAEDKDKEYTGTWGVSAAPGSQQMR